MSAELRKAKLNEVSLLFWPSAFAFKFQDYTTTDADNSSHKKYQSNSSSVIIVLFGFGFLNFLGLFLTAQTFRSGILLFGTWMN